MNGNVLCETLAFWLACMMVEMKNSFEVGANMSNEKHLEQLIDSSNGMIPRLVVVE